MSGYLRAGPIRPGRSDGGFVPRSLAADGFGGARRVRTDDLMLAKHALYQLSYGPSKRLRDASPWGVSSIRLPAQGVTRSVVGPGRLELPTSRLSGVCSNQLSYRPLKRSARASDPSQWTWRSNARSHRGRRPKWGPATVFTERETKTAAPRYLFSVP